MFRKESSVALVDSKRTSAYSKLNEDAKELLLRFISRMNSWPGFADSEIKPYLELALLPLESIPYRLARDFSPKGAKINLGGKNLAVVYRRGLQTSELTASRFTSPVNGHRPAETIRISACIEDASSCFDLTAIAYDICSGATIKTLRNRRAIEPVEIFIDRL